MGVFSCSAGGGAFAMEKCSTSPESGDGRTVFAATANGQLKMPRLGNYCLTMAGDGASDADVASGAGLVATSTNTEHAVNNIVDGNAQSYWASGSDPAAPVDVQLDFGTAKLIKSVEIEWEHPAQVFFVALCLLSCVFRMPLRAWAARHTSCKWPAAAGGQAYTALLATTWKRLPMWAQLFQALRFGSE
jgi:hypothetical protein